MKQEWLTTLKEMRKEGYCVVVFSPKELGDATPDYLEDILIQRGWDFIESQNSPNHMSTVFEV